MGLRSLLGVYTPDETIYPNRKKWLIWQLLYPANDASEVTEMLEDQTTAENEVQSKVAHLSREVKGLRDLLRSLRSKNQDQMKFCDQIRDKLGLEVEGGDGDDYDSGEEDE